MKSPCKIEKHAMKWLTSSYVWSTDSGLEFTQADRGEHRRGSWVEDRQGRVQKGNLCGGQARERTYRQLVDTHLAKGVHRCARERKLSPIH